MADTTERYYYRCEGGHHIVGTTADYRVCDAPVIRDGEVAPCGQDVEYIGVDQFDHLASQLAVARTLAEAVEAAPDDDAMVYPALRLAHYLLTGELDG